MEIQQTCIPCLKKSFIRLAEKVTDDNESQAAIINEGLRIIEEVGTETSAPYITGRLYNYMKAYINNRDPYYAEKAETNAIALNIIETLDLQNMRIKGQDPLETALRLSIAGNIIDFSVGYEISQSVIQQSVDDSLFKPIFGCSINDIKSAIDKANKILVLADNAGEIAFDKLLIEHLPKDRTTYVVKGGPCVNDATIEDAKAVGMENLVPVIDNGAAYQGTILSICSDAFNDAFNQADLIISKGQANFETLSDVKDKAIYYLMRAKCPVIANTVGCETGAFVLLTHL